MTLKTQRDSPAPRGAAPKTGPQAQHVLHVKMHLPFLTFCSLFCASADFPNGTNGDFSAREQHQVAFLLDLKRKMLNPMPGNFCEIQSSK